jgi:fibronectin type 3 domain-containing protein
LLIVLLVASGVGASLVDESSAQTCNSDVLHATGQWRTLPYQMPINPIDATLLHTGKVLIVAGSENDARNSNGYGTYRGALWDPTRLEESSVTVQHVDYDVFCSGVAILPDGRPLIVGGTSDYSFKGENRSSFFNPVSGGYAQTQRMVDGRWYATATTLADGRVMAFSGLTANGTSKTVEIYNVASAAGWSSPITVPFTPPLYPRMMLLPSGNVFYNGQGSGSRSANAWIFDPVARTWAVSAPTTVDRSYGSAVLLPLLPPSYTPRVMNFGGGNPSTPSTEIIDLSSATPAWTPGPPMSTGRIQMNAVILPNGKVLAEGGSASNESPNGPGKRADLYDPVANTMTSGGAASYSRLYHSVALLLPDATVVSMGSNPGSRGRYEAAIEIYTPPYLFDQNDELITTNRPRITGVGPVSGPFGYNAQFWVTYASTGAISSAVLVRAGSSTHAFDMEQRLVGLCGPAPQPPCAASGGTLDLTTPPDTRVAPPGYYMLFLLDAAGVPSEARFIQLSSYATTPPAGAIASPASSEVTIPAGGSVSFGTSTVAAGYAWIFPGGTPARSAAQNPNVVFSSPGEYTASLTVVDSNGNTDPDPPTRRIVVTPVAPDFEVDVDPEFQTVTPSSSTTFTVTVTPLSGFTGTVSFTAGSEAAIPAGVTLGAFDPPTVTGSGSSTFSVDTGSTAVPYALSLTVTGTSGTMSRSASTSLLVSLRRVAGLTATPSSGQVSLSWLATVGANVYHVKRAPVTGGPYVTVACPTATSYVDTGLTDGKTYHYVVSAGYTGGPNAGGESADSAEVSATPQPPPPPAPAALTATRGNAQVALTWTASAGATRYNVKRATASGGPYTVIASPTSTTFTNTGLVNGTTYYYVVSAVNGGGESGNSPQASATPQPPPPPAPTGLAATPGNAQVALSWTASAGATRYNVKRAAASGGPYTVVASPTSTTYTDTGLANGTAYFYVVSAVNGGGEGPNSAQVSATPRAVPSPPTGLSADGRKHSVRLHWIQSQTTGVTQNSIYRRLGTGSYPSTPTATIGATTSYVDGGRQRHTTYCYVVTARSASGESAPSSEACAATH